MDDHALIRYSRHILLPEIDLAGQERWLNARVLIVGAGGLGGPAALFLASAGVGHLTLADPDHVELTNLQRQILFDMAQLKSAKAESARDRLLSINPSIDITAKVSRLEGAALDEQVAAADLVLDCSDNFSTRYAINAACQRHRKPLVSGSAIRFEGQVAVFDPRHDDSPCYHCLFPEQAAEEQDMPCAIMGVFAPLVGVIGSLQAAEALKVLAGIGQPLTGRLLLVDLLSSGMRCIRVPRDPACPVCGEASRV